MRGLLTVRYLEEFGAGVLCGELIACVSGGGWFRGFSLMRYEEGFGSTRLPGYGVGELFWLVHASIPRGKLMMVGELVLVYFVGVGIGIFCSGIALV